VKRNEENPPICRVISKFVSNAIGLDGVVDGTDHEGKCVNECNDYVTHPLFLLVAMKLLQRFPLHVRGKHEEKECQIIHYSHA
jgi:hypothetical protein